jgi:ankyrin repeat protein
MGFFTKEHTNENFFNELLKKEFDKKWLENGLQSEFIDINHQDKNGDSFLIRCLKASKFRSAEWLINHGANVDLKNNEGKSPITIAIEKDNLAVVKGLLEMGKVDINQRDIDGRSLLQNIVVFGNHKMAKLFINKGADLNNTDHHERNVLFDALAYGDRTFLNYLLSLEQIDLNHKDAIGNTILQSPEVEKNNEIAKDLIIAGTDPTILPGNGDESFFFKTILKGKEKEDLINLSLDRGANVNATATTGNTIIIEIVKIASTLSYEEEKTKQYYLDTAQKMLEYGGDINAKDDESETMLFNAVRLRDFDIIAFLISGGIDPNIQNENGESVLFDIVVDGIHSHDLILLLAAYRANPNIKNKHGKSVYEVINDIIIHQFGTKQIEDQEFIEKLDPNGEYLIILKELLERDDEDRDYLDSTGNPLFFNPLLYGCFSLFKLYINYDLNIHALNQANHNIFYEYVLKVFEDNDSSREAREHFEYYLSALISHKVDKNYQDMLGWTILHKILTTPCNEKLFHILTKIVLFDYSISDNLGRTIVHNAVWGDKKNIIEKIDTIDHHIINQPDGYGILPITYAVLLGNAELVLLFVRLGSNIRGNKKISQQAIKKFSPMLKNLSKLTENVLDPDDLDILNKIIEQTKKDFVIID